MPVMLAALGPMQLLMELTTHQGESHPLDRFSILRMALPRGAIPQRLDTRTLSAEWSTWPFKAPTQALGDQWLREQSALALLVPSAIDPASHIVVINPAHPDFEKIEVVETRPLTSTLEIPR